MKTPSEGNAFGSPEKPSLEALEREFSELMDTTHITQDSQNSKRRVDLGLKLLTAIEAKNPTD